MNCRYDSLRLVTNRNEFDSHVTAEVAAVTAAVTAATAAVTVATAAVTAATACTNIMIDRSIDRTPTLAPTLTLAQ